MEIKYKIAYLTCSLSNERNSNSILSLYSTDILEILPPSVSSQQNQKCSFTRNIRVAQSGSGNILPLAANIDDIKASVKYNVDGKLPTFCHL